MPIIATDGSSLGTPMEDGSRKAEGHGGWSAVIRFEGDHPIAPAFPETYIFVSRQRRATGYRFAHGGKPMSGAPRLELEAR